MMRWLTVLIWSLVATGAMAYPLDGYDYSGISRLEYYRQIVTGEIHGTPVPVGARLPLESVSPRLLGDDPGIPFDNPDAALGKAIARTLGQNASDYAISVVDLSDPAQPVYAEHNAHIRRNVGSVGKMLIATSWFRLMADVYPDIADRERLLRETQITGDGFVRTDHHKVIFMDVETGARSYRTVREGDTGTLWDWIDWMLSASNNAAAATMQEQLMLFDHFRESYPPSPEQKAAYFADTPRAELSKQFLALMTENNARNGVDSEKFRQGSFFTREGKRRVPGTNSYGNTREIVKLLYRIERGELVDEWSSRELKRLLYMTQKRIRYASHPALNDYAVYYKSGSLYSCQEEEGFVCRKYAGNRLNLLASVAIVEGPVQGGQYHYMVAVSSNVLRVNSAVAHQTLAMRIHRLIEARHKQSSEGAPRDLPALPFDNVRLVGEAPPTGDGP